MDWNNGRKKALLPATLVTIVCVALPRMYATAPNVNFTATGTFTNPQISGNDTLKLAGEPFTINIVANAAAVPIQHGTNWALFSPLKMTGEVHSGLLGPTPINIASAGASILQAVGPSYDPVQTGFPVKVVGINLTINAQFVLPAGTLTKPLIHPFAAVALAPGNTTISYSNGTDTTTLTVDTGSLTASVAAPSVALDIDGLRLGSGSAPVQYTPNLYELSALVPRSRQDVRG